MQAVPAYDPTKFTGPGQRGGSGKSSLAMGITFRPAPITVVSANKKFDNIAKIVVKKQSGPERPFWAPFNWWIFSKADFKPQGSDALVALRDTFIKKTERDILDLQPGSMFLRVPKHTVIKISDLAHLNKTRLLAKVRKRAEQILKRYKPEYAQSDEASSTATQDLKQSLASLQNVSLSVDALLNNPQKGNQHFSPAFKRFMEMRPEEKMTNKRSSFRRQISRLSDQIENFQSELLGTAKEGGAQTQFGRMLSKIKTSLSANQEKNEQEVARLSTQFKELQVELLKREKTIRMVQEELRTIATFPIAKLSAQIKDLHSQVTESGAGFKSQARDTTLRLRQLKNSVANLLRNDGELEKAGFLSPKRRGTTMKRMSVVTRKEVPMSNDLRRMLHGSNPIFSANELQNLRLLITKGQIADPARLMHSTRKMALAEGFAKLL